MTDRAVVLARGLGTRMREQAPGAQLDAAQAAAADARDEGLHPDRPALPGLRPVRSCRRRCHRAVRGDRPRARRRAALLRVEVLLDRVTVEFAVQAEPRGTADAVLAAETWTEGEPFLVVNGDNYYPVPAPACSGGARRCPGWSRSVGKTAGRRTDRARAHPALRPARYRRLPPPAHRREARPGGCVPLRPSYCVSMNCWRFDPRIFDACRRVPLSPRGELELPMAVQHAIDDGRFPVEAVLSEEGVLDLSGRADIAAVAARLAGVEVQPVTDAIAARMSAGERRSSRGRRRAPMRWRAAGRRSVASVRAWANRGAGQAHRLRRRSQPHLRRRAWLFGVLCSDATTRAAACRCADGRQVEFRVDAALCPGSGTGPTIR